MPLWKTALVGALLLLGGCSFATDSLLPSLTGEEPSGKPKEQTAATQSAESAPVTTEPLTSQPGAPPQLNANANIQLVPIEPGSPTGTAVGQKVGSMRQDLGRLQGSITAHNNQLQSIIAQTTGNAQQYFQLVAAINAKLQVGTTPSNPILVNQWTQAQSILNKIDGDVSSLNSLSNGVANDSSQAAYLLEAIRATYTLPGAVDEDHRQLAVLEDETNKTVVSIDRLLNRLSEDTARQSLYVARERSNLETLSVAVKNGELLGGSLANRAFNVQPTATSPRSSAASRQSFTAGRRPLVVIRFDRPDVNYESALYTAVSQALARKPDAQFDIVAVAPTRGGAGRSALAVDQSKRNADAVMRSLTNMGLPADRMTLSSTTSRAAETTEVHLYVR